MSSAYLVTEITKIKIRKKSAYIVLGDNISSKYLTIFKGNNSYWCTRNRTDYKRVIIKPYLGQLQLSPGYCIIGYESKKPASKEYYWNKLGSLENPSEEEIACYIQIINELLDE